MVVVDGKKVCYRCKENKDISNFYKCPPNKNKDCYLGDCKECRKAIDKVYMNNEKSRLKINERAKRYAKRNPDKIKFRRDRVSMRNTLFLYNLKKDIPCKDCGQIFHPVCMDFDHVRGEKIKGVGLMKNLKRERMLKEIEKCELVCANCHRVRTHTRNGAIPRLNRLLEKENQSSSKGGNLGKPDNL
jgi:hypothetical protein